MMDQVQWLYHSRAASCVGEVGSACNLPTLQCWRVVENGIVLMLLFSELGLRDSNIPCGKLHLNLGKTKKRISRPERQDLQTVLSPGHQFCWLYKDLITKSMNNQYTMNSKKSEKQQSRYDTSE